MNGKRARSFRPGQVVDDVFRVYSVAQRVRAAGRPYLVLTLASERGRYEAITDWAAAEIALGDAVRVVRCVVRCGGKLVLVARLLWRVGWQTHYTGSNGNEGEMSTLVMQKQSNDPHVEGHAWK